MTVETTEGWALAPGIAWARIAGGQAAGHASVRKRDRHDSLPLAGNQLVGQRGVSEDLALDEARRGALAHDRVDVGGRDRTRDAGDLDGPHVALLDDLAGRHGVGDGEDLDPVALGLEQGEESDHHDDYEQHRGRPLAQAARRALAYLSQGRAQVQALVTRAA